MLPDCPRLTSFQQEPDDICNMVNSELLLHRPRGKIQQKEDIRVKRKKEPMDALSISSQVMDENIVGVTLKEETEGRFSSSYIEDICSGTFCKVFLPIDSHEVDFTDEMVKLELESQSGEHHIWAAQLATTTLCEQDDCGIHRNSLEGDTPENSNRASTREDKNKKEEKPADKPEKAKNPRNEEETSKPDGAISGNSKFYKIQCTICKKWFLNNDSMITHLRSHCGGGATIGATVAEEQCQVCQQTFPDNSSLHAHMLTHVGMNPVECNICQKRFAYKWCLKNHVQTHSTSVTKPFENCCPTGSNVVVVSEATVNLPLTGAGYTFESTTDQTRKLYDRTNPDDEQRSKEPDKTDDARLDLKCDVCKLRFKDKETLNRHALAHMSEGTYKYDPFAGNFRDKPEASDARVSPQTNSPKQFKCTLCERSFAQRTALNNHMLAHSGVKPHACNICEKTYKRKSELIRHTMVHTGERPYECKECLMTFREKAKLNSHMLVHTGEKPHECYICHKACARKSDLNSHMLSHTGGQYDCKVCEKIFTRKSDLNRHTLIHTGEKPFACEHCDMAFRERTRLNSHMLVHTGDKRHACHICGKTFREKSSLKKHMLVHTGDRPYECFICKKSFTQKTTLNSHVLIHTSERPYECQTCPKSFKEKSSLRKHSLFHNNAERAHECNVCFKKFPHKAALGSHAAIEHPS